LQGLRSVVSQHRDAAAALRQGGGACAETAAAVSRALEALDAALRSAKAALCAWQGRRATLLRTEAELAALLHVRFLAASMLSLDDDPQAQPICAPRNLGLSSAVRCIPVWSPAAATVLQLFHCSDLLPG
jgi:hypothetical protein